MADWATLTAVQLARFIAAGDPIVAAVSTDDLDTWVSLATSRLPASAWGAMHTKAVALLALHSIASQPAARGTSAGGPITAESRGDWSRSFGVVLTSADDAWLQTSGYGLQLLELRHSRAARTPFIVR